MVTAAKLDLLIQELRANSQIPLFCSAELSAQNEVRPMLCQYFLNRVVQIQSICKVRTVRLKYLHEPFVRLCDAGFNAILIFDEHRLYSWTLI